MTDTFKIYGNPVCSACDATKRVMTKEGVPWVYELLEDNPEIAERARTEGHRQAPYVIAPNGEVWSGFRLDKIRKHRDLLAE